MVHDLTRLHLAMATKMIHRDAIPAPLRIPSKQHKEVEFSALQAVKCDNLAKLPSQPVFGNPNVSEDDAIQISKACQCLKSPMSPLSSPISFQDSLVNRPRTASLDFSALFMKSPTLRQELEQCTCQRTPLARSMSISSSSEFEQSDTSSTQSGYTSVYSR